MTATNSHPNFSRNSLGSSSKYLSLSIPREGIVFGFLGANGSGKTTTGYCSVVGTNYGRAEVLGFDTRSHSIKFANVQALCWNIRTLRTIKRGRQLSGRAWRLPTAGHDHQKHHTSSNMGCAPPSSECRWVESRHEQKLAVARAMLYLQC